MMLDSFVKVVMSPARLISLRAVAIVGVLISTSVFPGVAVAQSDEGRSPFSADEFSATLDFSFNPRDKPSPSPAFSAEPIEFSFTTPKFSSSDLTLSRKRVLFLPSPLDFSPNLPEAEARAVQPRSFAPVVSSVSKPVFKLQPRPSKLPKREPPPPKPDPVMLKRDAPVLVGLTSADTAAAQTAWQYIRRNWNASTGLVNAVEDYPWTTLWDQGSAILGIHAARQLNLMTPTEFKTRMAPLLQTLSTLPLASTGLPNKAYSTRTAQMRTLDNAPDPQGRSGWSVLDTARLLLSLHIVRTHYPEYKPQINAIVKRWKLSQLVQAGWLQGGIPEGQHIIRVQEGRLGYEQYAAESLKLWNIEALKALSHPPTTTVQVEGIRLDIDQRNLKNSGASNYLTNDPYLFWGLELGWTEAVKPQVKNLLAVQRKRHERTGILTAVNEDSLDRPPYFLYNSVYADGKPWNAQSASGQPADRLKQLSTKAAFGWEVLLPNEPYTRLLRNAAQSLMNKNRGFFTGRFENQTPSVNTVFNVNTNAAVLESILFKARNQKPLILP